MPKIAITFAMPNQIAKVLRSVLSLFADSVDGEFVQLKLEGYTFSTNASSVTNGESVAGGGGAAFDC